VGRTRVCGFSKRILEEDFKVEEDGGRWGKWK